MKNSKHEVHIPLGKDSMEHLLLKQAYIRKVGS